MSSLPHTILPFSDCQAVTARADNSPAHPIFQSSESLHQAWDLVFTFDEYVWSSVDMSKMSHYFFETCQRPTKASPE
jgi:hypothetical protein